MRFSRKVLLPIIKRENNTQLEKFVVSQVNKKLKHIKKSGEFYDLVQMQYFFYEMYKNRGRRQELIKRLQAMK